MAEDSSPEGVTTISVAPLPLPAQEQFAAAPAAAPSEEGAAAEGVRSRSAAFKTRLEKIAKA